MSALTPEEKYVAVIKAMLCASRGKPYMPDLDQGINDIPFIISSSNIIHPTSDFAQPRQELYMSWEVDAEDKEITRDGDLGAKPLGTLWVQNHANAAHYSIRSSLANFYRSYENNNTATGVALIDSSLGDPGREDSNIGTKGEGLGDGGGNEGNGNNETDISLYRASHRTCEVNIVSVDGCFSLAAAVNLVKSKEYDSGEEEKQQDDGGLTRIHPYPWNTATGSVLDHEELVQKDDIKKMVNGDMGDLRRRLRKGKERGIQELEEPKPPQIAEPGSFDGSIDQLIEILYKYCTVGSRGERAMASPNPEWVRDDTTSGDLLDEDACKNDEGDYPRSLQFWGYDGASESTIQAPPVPANNRSYPRSGRQQYSSMRQIYGAAAAAAASQHIAPRSKRAPHESELSKTWLRSRATRVRTLPEHLKTNEDRLIEWLNSELDENPATANNGVISLGLQIFSLLKPRGGLGAAVAPSCVPAAHAATYLAAQTSLLGILPIIGMARARCISCNEEVGKKGEMTWWRCKGCSIGENIICNRCFAKGVKCRKRGHTADSIEDLYQRDVEHLLMRCGTGASVEDVIIAARRTRSETELWNSGRTQERSLYAPIRQTRSHETIPVVGSSKIQLPTRESFLGSSGPSRIASNVPGIGTHNTYPRTLGSPPASSSSRHSISAPENSSIKGKVTETHTSPQAPAKGSRYLTVPIAAPVPIPIPVPYRPHLSSSKRKKPERLGQLSLGRYSPPPHRPKPKHSVSSLLPGIPTPSPTPPPPPPPKNAPEVTMKPDKTLNGAPDDTEKVADFLSSSSSSSSPVLQPAGSGGAVTPIGFRNEIPRKGDTTEGKWPSAAAGAVVMVKTTRPSPRENIGVVGSLEEGNEAGCMMVLAATGLGPGGYRNGTGAAAPSEVEWEVEVETEVFAMSPPSRRVERKGGGCVGKGK